MDKQKSEYQYFQEITMDGLIDIKPEKNKLSVKEKPKKKIKDKYGYSGPVKRFDDIVITNFEAMTMALTEKQATNFITHQAKKRLGLKSSAGGVKLCNKVVKL